MLRGLEDDKKTDAMDLANDGGLGCEAPDEGSNSSSMLAIARARV